ncbi:transposase, partial [Pseudoalteromonas piscicida]
MLDELIDKYRGRLADISWFMRVLNEDIARRANKEDNCTGRFWEGRFKSQALLDEAALAACLAYVDLNPVRAKIAATPETSDYTSIKKRIDHAKLGKQPKSLLRFAGSPRQHMPKGLPFELKSYIELVELTGLCIRADKRGYINEAQSILTRLNID